MCTLFSSRAGHVCAYGCAHLPQHGLTGRSAGCLCGSLVNWPLSDRLIMRRTVEALAGSCRETLATLDLSGCSGVARRSHEELRAVLPRLRCFVVHS